MKSTDNEMRITLPKRDSIICASMVAIAGFLLSYYGSQSLGPAIACATCAATCLCLDLFSDHAYRIAGRFEFYVGLILTVPVISSLIIGSSVFAFAMVSSYADPFLLVTPVIACFYGFAFGLFASIGYIVVRPFRPVAPVGHVGCRQCGYRVDNVIGRNCPECGTVIKPWEDDWVPAEMSRKRVETVKKNEDQ